MVDVDPVNKYQLFLRVGLYKSSMFLLSCSFLFGSGNIATTMVCQYWQGWLDRSDVVHGRGGGEKNPEHRSIESCNSGGVPCRDRECSLMLDFVPMVSLIPG